MNKRLERQANYKAKSYSTGRPGFIYSFLLGALFFLQLKQLRKMTEFEVGSIVTGAQSTVGREVRQRRCQVLSCFSTNSSFSFPFHILAFNSLS